MALSGFEFDDASAEALATRHVRRAQPLQDAPIEELTFDVIRSDEVFAISHLRD